MSERIWTEQEIAAFKQAELQLAARGMYVEGPKGEANGAQFMRWFDAHPQESVTVDKLLWLFGEFKKYPNGIFHKSDAQMKFENAAQRMSPQDLDALEKFLRNNRLWPDDEGAFHNGVLFISVMTGRPYDTSTLASRIPYIMNSLKEKLVWKDPSQASTYRLTGKHSGGDAHFARRSESNTSFSHRAANNSTEIPHPVSTKTMDDFQWNQMADSLCGERHSETASIKKAIKTVRDQGGTAEEAYREGVRIQRRIESERARGR